ncbi:MAG: D-tyrosyl-tRNA(Tyr) deacylase [Clostridiales bacterium]|nr:D-tyrosyl-tRNA(Tyr) deacylase [Clostridiales bacterium]
MKLVIQRVKEASVMVNGDICGSIGQGYLVLVGISDSDTEETADKMISKMIKLRIFEDEKGKTNLDLAAVDGRLLIVSQFTLYADCRHGNRPSFIQAGAPAPSEQLYDYFVRKAGEFVPDLQHGIFGADMKVSLVNDGPFTIILDSKELGI